MNVVSADSDTLRDALAGRPAGPTAVARRLRPLAVGTGLQSLLLWVPVEKLFMTEIGFDAAAIGVVAAVYAAVVPLLEVPFGVLADRWSRTGVLVLATFTLAASSLVGGLSNDPVMYAVAAVLLGVYFALDSGTADSIVYDTLVEETGSGDDYEAWIGRLHVVEAVALVVSSVAGGVLAAVSSPRVTYFATVPLVALAAIAFSRCREPMLHRTAERVSYRRQAALTIRALSGRAPLRRAVLLAALTATIAQVIFEFGPLWLVGAHAPSSWYGPYWAALVSTVGVGAWFASRVDFARGWVLTLIGATSTIAALLLVAASALPVVIAMQILLALIAAMVGVRASFLMHEAVQANIRAGVSSGASTLGWLTFVPLSLLFGWITRAQSVHTAGWLLVLVAAALALLVQKTPIQKGIRR
jgi:MFS family permease